MPATLREHLDGCAECTAWWQNVVRIEGLIEQLPVPASAEKKAALIASLTEPEPIIRPRFTTQPATAPFFTRRRVAYFTGLAASGVLAVGAWMAVRGPGPTPLVKAPKHPLLDTVVQRNVALAKAVTPAERLMALGGWADDIRTKARDLARVASQDDLKTLAGWYDKLVRDGLVQQAEKMPALAMEPVAKAKLLNDLAGKLANAGDDAERLVKEVPPGAQSSLQRIAESARDGEQKLRRLAGGGA